jgi:hypothetical protein
MYTNLIKKVATMKTVSIHIKISQEDKNAIEANARRLDITVSDLLRSKGKLTDKDSDDKAMAILKAEKIATHIASIETRIDKLSMERIEKIAELGGLKYTADRDDKKQR